MFKRLKRKISMRRDGIIEGRIKDMVSRAEGYAVFDDIFSNPFVAMPSIGELKQLT